MKNKLTGWKDIFTFSLIQSLKAKSMVISNIVLCTIVLLSIPVISLINGSHKDSKRTTDISTVKIVDMTGLGIINNVDEFNTNALKETDSEDFEEDSINQVYSKVKYEASDIDLSKFETETDIEKIYEFEKDADYVYLQIAYLENSFDLQVIYSSESKIGEKDAEEYSEFISNNFKNVLLGLMQLDEEQIKILDTTVMSTYYRDLKEDENVENDGDKVISKEELEEKEKRNKIEDNHYNIIYGVMMIVLFVLAFGGERIAMSIVTEKASKVLEFLMTSVKPMAIVVGKTLSSLLVLFIQGALLLMSFVVSIVINGILFNDGKIVLPSFLKGIFNMDNFEGLNIGSLLIGIGLFILGFIFYALIAALCGASVSKIDEIAEGIKIFTMLLVISAYMVMFFSMSRGYEGDSIYKTVILFLPFTSLFFTPSVLFTGYATMIEGIISLVILCIVVVLMVKFVASVYESMIYYSGTPLKIKDIINISKQNKKSYEDTERNK
ncbi:MAG: ABC transporter permease [Lachnospiraceae bacterium]|nr:ABC transporter permease [Lachnospiraceae bacterium]